jgi:YegS/Rv2252/BmrU family lipid kinase
MQQQPQKNIAIVCNLLAGAGKAILMAQKLQQELSKKNMEHTLFQENWPLHFSNFTDVFIVGGDGTLNYFINHYPDIALPLVIFNGGTGNDFHWLLYAQQTFEEQLHNALTKAPQPIDKGICNERYFVNGVGIGFEGEVAKALTGKKKRAGKTSFLISILKRIFTYRSKYYTVISEELQMSGKKLLVDVSNGRRAGGGFHIAPQAKADDGLLDVIIADALNPFERLRFLPVIEKGKHLHLPFIHHYCSRKVLIKSEKRIQYHLDGEYLEAAQLEIEILPASLKFRY